MKGRFLFLVIIGLFSPLIPAYAGGWISPVLFLKTMANNIDSSQPVFPVLVVEEVKMEVTSEAPIYNYDLKYEVDTANATFTLISQNYAIDQLGFKLISQKSGDVLPAISALNDKKIQLDLSKEPKGTYYLRLCQKSGNIIKIYRLIKAQ